MHLLELIRRKMFLLKQTDLAWSKNIHDHQAIDLSTFDHRPQGMVLNEGKQYSSDLEGDTAIMTQVYIDRQPSNIDRKAWSHIRSTI